MPVKGLYLALRSGVAVAKAVHKPVRDMPISVAQRTNLHYNIVNHKNSFSRAIIPVNSALDKQKEQLSPFSREKLETLCNDAESGSITPKQAHSYEACHWVCGAPENYGACTVGFFANWAASIESDRDDPAIFPQSAGKDQ